MSEDRTPYIKPQYNAVRSQYLRDLLTSSGFRVPIAALTLEIDEAILAEYCDGTRSIPHHVIFACEWLEHLTSGLDPRRLCREAISD
jgi:hypothetical protein